MPTTINGTTGIDAVQPGTITQADLATNVAGNGPAFAATSNLTTALTPSTYVKVPLNVETFDTANAFDSTTNYRFQPQVAGYYQLDGAASVNPAVNLSRVIAAVYVNGAAAVPGIDILCQTATAGRATVSGLVYLNGSTDYAELFMWVTATSASFQSLQSRFSGFLARAA